MVKDAYASYRRSRNAEWTKINRENAHNWMEAV